MKDKETFYKNLKKQLDDTSSFPSKYLFKFIVPTEHNEEQEVKALFNKKGIDIKTKNSKTGKFTSLSVLIQAANSEEIIAYYQKAEKIKGIISL